MFVTINISTKSPEEFIDITSLVEGKVRASGVKEGLITVFIPHTTASVTINENADPSVAKDIISNLDKVIPPRGNYSHMEGNSHAHIKSSLIGSSRQIIIQNGRLKLGTWQGIYFCEFDGPRKREVWVKISD
ncbi:MAG: secondary thiamine-phosphate synthase enzyme YjbQ [Candidatus Omnitrophica bacterium]|nr:secondary thiamine-phosphate synthase enzyme YjbQ [Candidatus Omnitrophota bacterium]MBU1047544.1 secondary thiamine-phosphate synthase enzyme YjbQ [Candidatus Omnitrophota bacterium]MBU1630944.1 secondary thiamine-phosphate synthase enzyme YjbQ [Candidatus Omnitrophota bacterium]MBU1766815.1 secondary thiamine-phosphate synthase enzyme YjbQ [Candidatus Omnitrophota bacterium]MBU1888907.1 secondary thiamine-phosphate synthase enzyme YjbQ [Candidatus Omnitrophota bacterium]